MAVLNLLRCCLVWNSRRVPLSKVASGGRWVGGSVEAAGAQKPLVEADRAIRWDWPPLTSPAHSIYEMSPAAGERNH